ALLRQWRTGMAHHPVHRQLPVPGPRPGRDDPEYVRAAQAVADLGEAGFFEEGVGSIDMDTSTHQFLTGDAAMFYMGSWALSDFNNEEGNDIGAENIGFMPFPEV